MEYKAMFARLNSNNYFTWKYKMEMYLRKEKCWIAISNEQPVVPELVADGANQAAVTATTTARATFVEKNE